MCRHNCQLSVIIVSKWCRKAQATFLTGTGLLGLIYTLWWWWWWWWWWWRLYTQVWLVTVHSLPRNSKSHCGQSQRQPAAGEGRVNTLESCYRLAPSRGIACFVFTAGDWVQTKLHWTKPHWTNPHWTKPHWTKPHWTKPHWTKPHWTKPHWTKPHWTKPHWTKPHWTKPHWTNLQWTNPHWTNPQWTKPHWTILTGQKTYRTRDHQLTAHCRKPQVAKDNWKKVHGETVQAGQSWPSVSSEVM